MILNFKKVIVSFMGKHQLSGASVVFLFMAWHRPIIFVVAHKQDAQRSDRNIFR